MALFDIIELTGDKVLPVLPGKVAAAQLQSIPSHVQKPVADVEVGSNIHAGNFDLNNAPVLYNEQQAEASKFSQFGTPMVMPLEIRIDGQADFWLLPIEPIITLNGGKILSRRNVAKGRYQGSVKAEWALDDYSISIDGMFRGANQFTYPEADVKRLRDLCEATKVLFVRCPIFQTLNINQMVIEKWDLPFTKGDDMQAYRLDGYSDKQFSLLIELD